jgi:WD40 repeat protein
VIIWDAASQKEYRFLSGYKGMILKVVFSSDSRRLVTEGGDGLVKIWDLGTRKETASFKGSEVVLLGPDGKHLAAASPDHHLQIRDAATGRVDLELPGHTGGITALACRRDGKLVASASVDKTVKVWDVRSRKLLYSQPNSSTGGELTFSPDGQQIVFVGRNMVGTALAAEIKAWDAETGAKIIEFVPKHADAAGDVLTCLSPDGSRLVSASANSNLTRLSGSEFVHVWDTQSGKKLPAITSGIPAITSRLIPVMGLAFAPDSLHLAGAVQSGRENVLKVWDTTTGRESLVVHTRKSNNLIKGVAFSPDGKRLAAGEGDTVRVWNAASGEIVLSAKFSYAEHVAFSPDGGHIAAVGGGRLKVWDAATGQEVMTASQCESCVSYSPDGRRLASAGEQNTAKIWDAPSGKLLLTLTGHTDEITSLAFSTDGKRLVSGSMDKTVKLWDAETGHEVFTLREHGNAVSGVAFSRDCRFLATASFDGTVKVWQAAEKPVF